METEEDGRLVVGLQDLFMDWEVAWLRARRWEGCIPANKVEKGDFVDILHY